MVKREPRYNTIHWIAFFQDFTPSVLSTLGLTKRPFLGVSITPLENISFVVEDKECMPEMHFLVGGLPHLRIIHASKRIRSSTALGTGGKAWEHSLVPRPHPRREGLVTSG